MYISDKKKLSKMFQKYSKLCLPGQYGKVRMAGRYMSKYAKQKPCTPAHCRLLPQSDRPVILISGLGCALTFASEAKFEIEAKISFRLEAKKKPDFT